MDQIQEILLRYCSQIKIEILSTPLPMRCCQETFLAALWDEKKAAPVLLLPAEQKPAAELSLQKLVSTFSGQLRPGITQGASFSGNKTGISWEYSWKSFREITLNRLDPSDIDSKRGHCLKAFMKGIFIRSGYIQDPQENYHLEITLPDGQLLEFFTVAVERMKLPFKYCARNNGTLAYIKGRMHIRKFLRTLELFDFALSFDDLIATRNLLSLVNRQVNFETANITKTVTASEKSIESINKLFSHPDSELMSENLRQVARKRVDHPLDSLEKLGKRFSPPISKSALNHRLRRIAELCRKLFGTKEPSEEESSE